MFFSLSMITVTLTVTQAAVCVDCLFLRSPGPDQAPSVCVDCLFLRSPSHGTYYYLQADQDFERFGKTLIANFKDTATLWEFLRASLRQCNIHKL